MFIFALIIKKERQMRNLLTIIFIAVIGILLTSGPPPPKASNVNNFENTAFSMGEDGTSISGLEILNGTTGMEVEISPGDYGYACYQREESNLDGYFINNTNGIFENNQTNYGYKPLCTNGPFNDNYRKKLPFSSNSFQHEITRPALRNNAINMDIEYNMLC